MTSKIVQRSPIDSRIIVLAGLAVAGLYLCMWLLGDAVWELSAKIDVLMEAVTTQE